MDLELLNAIEKEEKRQKGNIELIASENFVSKDVLKAVGSVLTNKYAEGYPSKRYYGGCEAIDIVENLAIDRAKKIFKAEHVNVQPHSGSQANMAVYMAVLNHGDKIMGMDLNAGGHLTHGFNLNFSGKLYNVVSYGVNKDSEMLDYEEIRQLALKEKPNMFVVGASAYSREIDFKKFREICDEVNCYMMVDMAHIAGLVAVGLHNSPVPYADFVTSTTHKTLRGPRGGLILCKEKYASVIDKTVFPGIQGGPLMHVIAGKAACFYEILQPEFKLYCENILNNCRALADTLKDEGFRLVSGGSDNHLINVDVKASVGITGKMAEKLLDEVNITCNKNTIPFDSEKPFISSGIRLGTPAMTTKGFNENDFRTVGKLISRILKNPNDETVKAEVKLEVKKLVEAHPFY